jgi:hypothetical protein
MYLLMRHPAGITFEAVILARGKNRMRVVVSGFPDTIELRRFGSQWFDEEQQPMELEFLMCSGSLNECLPAPLPAGIALRATE